MHVACWVPKDRVSWHNFPKINERVDTLFWHSRVASGVEDVVLTDTDKSTLKLRKHMYK